MEISRIQNGPTSTPKTNPLKGVQSRSFILHNLDDGRSTVLTSTERVAVCRPFTTPVLTLGPSVSIISAVTLCVSLPCWSAV